MHILVNCNYFLITYVSYHPAVVVQAPSGATHVMVHQTNSIKSVKSKFCVVFYVSKMKNAQNDMGRPKNALKDFRPKLPLPRWGGGGGGGGSKNEKCSE